MSSQDGELYDYKLDNENTYQGKGPRISYDGFVTKR